MTPDGAYIAPGLHEDRQEALLIHALARSGAEASIMLPFRVLGGEPPHRCVEIDEPMPNAASDVGLMQPTRRAWGVGAPRRRGEAFFKRRS